VHEYGCGGASGNQQLAMAVFQIVYMTGMAYGIALLVYQGGLWLGFH
jgi:hypothetical protein